MCGSIDLGDNIADIKVLDKSYGGKPASQSAHSRTKLQNNTTVAITERGEMPIFAKSRHPILSNL